MSEMFGRILQALANQMSEPLWLKLIFQPSTTAVVAIMDGVRYALRQTVSLLFSPFQ